MNIPTGELADFVADEEKQPTTKRYPRDPTLDPQLVWNGKDEQDLADYLSIATVPVYIQEKVEPRALVENFRQTGGSLAPPTLFEDFDGLDFDQLVEFYAHEGNWSNRLILGDALLVMNSLAEKASLTTGAPDIAREPYWRGIKAPDGRNEICPCRSGRKSELCPHNWGEHAPSMPTRFDQPTTH